MLTALRREAQAVLEEAAVIRKPALRRSDDPDALLATDLPMVTDDAAVERFMAEMAEQGWRVSRAGDWLVLDKDVPVPESMSSAALAGEIGCCASLLERHPCGETDKRAIRAVIKAAESGRPALERLCGKLHAQWAEALREHRALPGDLLPYLCQAHHITK